VPRLAVINASGANTLNQLYQHRGLRWNGGHVDCEIIGQFYGEMNEGNVKANTIASAIEIGRPVNLPKALKALDTMNGVTREVSDDEILEARAMVARWGFGCEPASAASVAGLQKLLADGTIDRDARVACILTGHELKDANATVKYHTGIDLKAAQDLAPVSEPHGKLSNRPFAVSDHLGDIIAALGGDPRLADKIQVDASGSGTGGEY
jgi:threonine synthase